MSAIGTVVAHQTGVCAGRISGTKHCTASVLRRPARCVRNSSSSNANMPDLDGLEVLRRLKEREPLKRVPVLFYSASSDETLIERARALGAADWVIKGVTGWLGLLAKVNTLHP